jgi:hypothetical protein
MTSETSQGINAMTERPPQTPPPPRSSLFAIWPVARPEATPVEAEWAGWWWMPWVWALCVLAVLLSFP